MDKTDKKGRGKDVIGKAGEIKKGKALNRKQPVGKNVNRRETK